MSISALLIEPLDDRTAHFGWLHYYNLPKDIFVFWIRPLQ